MLLLIAAAVGFGSLSGATTTMPWMIALTLVVGGVSALLALASGSSWLGVLGFAVCAGAAFQLSYVIAAVLQEAVVSRSAKRNASTAIQG